MNQVESAVHKHHPFAELLGIEIDKRRNGECDCSVNYDEKLLNPNNVMHGAVIYAMADTGMGGALQSTLEGDELCATIEIKITYLHAAGHEDLRCHATVLKKGRRVAMLEADVFSAEQLVAKATGSFAVFSS